MLVARARSSSGHEMREIVNAILNRACTGCQRRYLPHDLPPRSAVYYYFGTWRDDGGTPNTLSGSPERCPLRFPPV